MRKLSHEAKNLIREGATFVFAFDLELENGKKLYLTNNSQEFTLEETTYAAYSSLEITKAHFNDSAHDWVEIKGNYDNNAIEILDIIKDAKVKIKLIFIEQKLIEDIATLFCFNVHKENIHFILHLKSQIHNLEKNVTKFYSKICRANLGDKECGVDLNSISQTVRISSISGTMIFLDIDKQLGYYDYGKVHFSDTSKPILIIRQTTNSLILAEAVPAEFCSATEVRISPGCDKKIKTCCNKFNNVLNFRGEPFLPEMIYERMY